MGGVSSAWARRTLGGQQVSWAKVGYLFRRQTQMYCSVQRIRLAAAAPPILGGAARNERRWPIADLFLPKVLPQRWRLCHRLVRLKHFRPTDRCPEYSRSMTPSTSEQNWSLLLGPCTASFVARIRTAWMSSSWKSWPYISRMCWAILGTQLLVLILHTCDSL